MPNTQAATTYQNSTLGQILGGYKARLVNYVQVTGNEMSPDDQTKISSFINRITQFESDLAFFESKTSLSVTDYIQLPLVGLRIKSFPEQVKSLYDPAIASKYVFKVCVGLLRMLSKLPNNLAELINFMDPALLAGNIVGDHTPGSNGERFVFTKSNNTVNNFDHSYRRRKESAILMISASISAYLANNPDERNEIKEKSQQYNEIVNRLSNALASEMGKLFQEKTNVLINQDPKRMLPLLEEIKKLINTIENTDFSDLPNEFYGFDAYQTDSLVFIPVRIQLEASYSSALEALRGMKTEIEQAISQLPIESTPSCSSAPFILSDDTAQSSMTQLLDDVAECVSRLSKKYDTFKIRGGITTLGEMKALIAEARHSIATSRAERFETLSSIQLSITREGKITDDMLAMDRETFLDLIGFKGSEEWADFIANQDKSHPLYSVKLALISDILATKMRDISQESIDEEVNELEKLLGSMVTLSGDISDEVNLLELFQPEQPLDIAPIEEELSICMSEDEPDEEIQNTGRLQFVNTVNQELDTYLAQRNASYNIKDQLFLLSRDGKKRNAFIGELKIKLAHYREDGNSEPVKEYITQHHFPGENLYPLLNRIVCQLQETPKTDSIVRSYSQPVNEAFSELRTQITTLKNQAEALDNSQDKAVVTELADQLENELNYYLASNETENDLKTNFIDFNSRFLRRLHSQDDKMNNHRGCKKWLSNVAWGLFTLGVALGVKALYTKVTLGCYSLFSKKTKRIENVDNIENTFNNVAAVVNGL